MRYDRETIATTLAAMRRVEEIRARRERRFYKERMKGNKARMLEDDRKLVRENQHLLPPEERDKVDQLLGETADMEGVEGESEAEEDDVAKAKSREQEDLDREESARNALKASEAKGKKVVKKERRKAIVGQRMDIDT